jgi:hypothetical protein
MIRFPLRASALAARFFVPARLLIHIRNLPISRIISEELRYKSKIIVAVRGARLSRKEGGVSVA